MPVLKHPLSGASYSLRSDGLVDVENNGLKGVFHYDGRHHSGDITFADPHMLLVEGAGKRLLYTGDFRRHGRKSIPLLRPD